MDLKKAVQTVMQSLVQGRFDSDIRLLLDTTRDHYQYARVGWHNDNFVQSIFVHIDIKDGLVWVQCDNTELNVVDRLLEQGIPEKQIVLGFQAPHHRQYTGFATGSEVLHH
jgi:hypothetical protein